MDINTYISNPIGQVFIIECVFILILLSWILLIFLKVIFKKYFENRFWKDAFLLTTVSSTFVEIYLASFDALGVADNFREGFQVLDLSGHPTTEEFNSMFFPLLTVFFFIYLTHFIVRLVRYKKAKAAVTADNQ